MTRIDQAKQVMSKAIKTFKRSFNFLSYVQAKYRLFIKKEYNRVFNDPDFVENLFNKIRQCNGDCFKNNECKECFCNFEEMIISDKTCVRWDLKANKTKENASE